MLTDAHLFHGCVGVIVFFFSISNKIDTKKCWCSGEKDVDELFRHGKGTCDMRCPGNPKKNCGGEALLPPHGKWTN